MRFKCPVTVYGCVRTCITLINMPKFFFLFFNINKPFMAIIIELALTMSFFIFLYYNLIGKCTTVTEGEILCRPLSHMCGGGTCK